MVNPNVKSEEIKKIQNCLEDSCLFRMAAFADLVDRYVDIHLKANVNWLQTYALILLIIHDHNLTPSELGLIMLRPKDSITKLVGTLVKEGLVKRQRNGKDRRSFQIKLTPTGFAYITKTLEDIEPIEKRLRSSMEPSEINKLFSLTRPLGNWFADQARIDYY